jgi:hypothetical protein
MMAFGLILLFLVAACKMPTNQVQYNASTPIIDGSALLLNGGEKYFSSMKANDVLTVDTSGIIGITYINGKQQETKLDPDGDGEFTGLDGKAKRFTIIWYRSKNGADYTQIKAESAPSSYTVLASDNFFT